MQIEERFSDFCLEKGLQSFGVVLDAFFSLLNSGSKRRYYFEKYTVLDGIDDEIRNYIDDYIEDIAKVIEEPFREAVSEFELSQEQPKNILLRILERYQRRGLTGQRRSFIDCEPTDDKSIQIYQVLWTPSFRELEKRIIKGCKFKKKDQRIFHVADLIVKNIYRTIVDDDELLDEVVIAEFKDREMDRITHHEKHPKQDHVQLKIEKAVLDVCLDDCFQPYGAVMDALLYIIEGHNFSYAFFDSYAEIRGYRSKSVKEHIRNRIINLSEKLEGVFLQAVENYNLNKKDSKEILSEIYGRYSRHSKYNQRRRWGDKCQKIISDSKHPYWVMWAPWFKKLHEKWKEHRDTEKKYKEFDKL